MTAIADIIVNPSAQQQKPELQISPNQTNFSQSSSNSISFAQMLESNRSEKVPENTEEKTSLSEQTPKTDDYDKTSEKEAVAKTDDAAEEKAAETSENKSDNFELKVAENSKNPSTEEKTEDVKGKNLFGLKKTNEVQKKETSAAVKENGQKDKKAKQISSKDQSEKKEKLEDDFNRLNQLLNNKYDAEDVKNVQAAGKIQAEIKDNEKSENLAVESLGNLADVKETSEFGKNRIDFDAEKGKVSKLDKDGKILVKDLRKEEPETKESETKSKNTVKLDTKLEINDKNTATITMDLAGQDAENNILSLNSQTAASEGSDFQAMLNNQIQQSAPEFVKAGSIILKDNDKGTINLVLHPDDLGSVKIHLSLDGKTVSAHITVNTKEALEVFKDNAQTLREAFAQNGFDTSNFDVSYGNSNGQESQGFENKYDGSEFLARKAYGDYADNGLNDFYSNDEYFDNYSEYSVNIVA